jgi:hypothetical protein
MEMLEKVVKQFDNPDEALVFLGKIEPKIKANDVAVALCNITKGDIALAKKKDDKLAKVGGVVGLYFVRLVVVV